MGKVEIKTGDTINGMKVKSICIDPFKSGQVNIFVDAYESNWQGDISQIIFRVGKVDNNE